jgi:diacylglycerol O-acyltransferase
VEQLGGLDATFLYLETPSLHMHVSMAAVFDPLTVPGGYSWEKLRSLVGSRLALAPVFTRRLVEVPFRLGHPYWVDDSHFDLDYHMRRAALPSPGGIDELAEFVGDVCSRQLDRSKPLWEMYVVEKLEGDRIAIVTKIHHSTIDGVSGAELLARLFDLQADPGGTETTGDVRRPESTPSEVELVARALLSRLRKPIEVTQLAWKTGRAVLDVRRVRHSGDTAKAPLPLTTPRTSLNAAITPHRKVAFSSISLDDAKKVKNELGTTVNDVVLAVCAGALRRYLLEEQELPDQPLVATVPVSVAPKVGARRGANKVSAMWVALPCNIEDPVERLTAIRGSTKGAKQEQAALGAEVLLDWAEHATPNVFSAAARTYTRLRLAERHRPIHSLVISNVPGPDFPLYLAGAEMVAGFPLGPVMDGAGLNITVMSYRGVLNWGLMACRETLPRLDQLAAHVPGSLEELMSAAGLGAPEPVGIAPGKGPHPRLPRPAVPGAGAEAGNTAVEPAEAESDTPGAQPGAEPEAALDPADRSKEGSDSPKVTSPA